MCVVCAREQCGQSEKLKNNGDTSFGKRTFTKNA